MAINISAKFVCFIWKSFLGGRRARAILVWPYQNSLRFKFNSHCCAGRVTGGSLKTTAQADQESLQAGWFSKLETSLTRLRANDILRLIDAGREWNEGKRFGGLPVEVGHVSSSLRLILVTQDNNQPLVLVRSQGQGSSLFPSVDVGHSNITEMVQVRAMTLLEI